MSKTDPEILKEVVNQELTSYLGSGQINPSQFVSASVLEQYELEDFFELKTIHFILQDYVIRYLDRLPDRLRRLKTVTRSQSNIARGEIDGKVNWSNTYRERFKRGHQNQALFSTESPSPVADIAENRVLKSFLEKIQNGLQILDAYEYEWSDKYEDAVITHIFDALNRHVLLSDSSIKAGTISNRELKKARQSRHDIYSEAAYLYELYDDLHRNNFHRPEVRKVLADTIIVPSEDFRLFELFCTFRILRAIAEYYSTAHLNKIQPGDDAIAEISVSRQDTEESIRLYWDQTGPYDFSEDLPKLAETEQLPSQLQHFVDARVEGAAVAKAFQGVESNPSFYSGRPDLIVERRNIDVQPTQPLEVIVGEYKYSKRSQRFQSAARELSEYLRFIKSDETERYLFTESDVVVNGILCTEQTDLNHTRINNIGHISTADLQNDLAEVAEAERTEAETLAVIFDSFLS